MRRNGVLIGVILSIGAQVSCAHGASMTASSTPAPSRSESMGASMSTDTLGPLRQRAVAAVLQRIAGRENAPADSVFQNVRVLRGLSARQLLNVMNDGFGHGLGVSCGFCHVPGQFASDQKPNKNTARDMLRMVSTINADLRTMPNLPDSNARVGCITCHRMAPKPMLIGR